MNRILVTGGCGFIGSHFLRFILKSSPKLSVVNLDKLTYAGNRANTREFETNKQYEFVHGDICDEKLVRRLMEQVDGVVHFASETHVDRSIVDASDFVWTNVVGTRVLLEAARKNGVKQFIHFSTDEVYGSIRKGSFSETDALSPSSPYSASKAAGDLLALSYWKTYGLPVIVMRSSNNFGPYQFPEKVIPLFITNLIEGKKVPLYAQGENMRDWIFVGECVKGIDFIMKHGQSGEIYNLAAGSELSNKALTRLILKEFDRGEEAIQYVPDRPAHDFRYSVSAKKLRDLGFTPSNHFGKELKDTIQWYRDHRSWWQPLKHDAFTLK